MCHCLIAWAQQNHIHALAAEKACIQSPASVATGGLGALSVKRCQGNLHQGRVQGCPAGIVEPATANLYLKSVYPLPAIDNVSQCCGHLLAI